MSEGHDDRISSGRHLRLGARPLAQLSSLGSGRWEATGDDPQMALDLPEPVVLPGVYRVVVELSGAVVRPCLYLDFGAGWSEATQRVLEPVGGDVWTALVSLPRLAGVQRFDPSERPGRFDLGDISIERVPDADAILLLLEREATMAPDAAAALIGEASVRAARDGLQATCAWLMEGGARSLRHPASSYQAWVHTYDPGDAIALDAQRRIDALPRRPLVTLLLPAAGIRCDRLAACIDAVIAQAYPDWELCIVDGAAVSSGTRALLTSYLQSSSRVRILPGSDDGGWRVLLQQSKGDYVASLAGAQRLSPHALLAFVETLLAGPGARIVYSDSDVIDDDGMRSDPWFRPDWNPDLFLSQDYLAGAVVVESSLLRRFVQDGRAGADPVAAALADCVAAAGSEPVHLPFVLWHWPPDYDPQRDHATRHDGLHRILADTHPGVRLEAVDTGTRVRWPLPAPAPKASLIVPTRDRVGLLRRCVGSILELTTYPDYEIIVVDNQSVEPETLDYLAELAGQPRVRVVKDDRAFNYAAINNRAVAECRGDVVGLINNDLEVITPDWLEEMVSHAMRPGIGAVGAMLYYPDDTIQHAGVVLGLGGVAGHVYSRQPRGTAGAHGRAALVQNMSAVTAACLLVRKATYLEAGGMEERLTVAFNDVDFCLRLLERGYRNVWTPFAEFYHHESATRGDEDTPEKLARFRGEVSRMVETWGHALAGDRAYNPNLSLEHGNAMTLAWPPRRTYPVVTADAVPAAISRPGIPWGTSGPTRRGRPTDEPSDGPMRHA